MRVRYRILTARKSKKEFWNVLDGNTAEGLAMGRRGPQAGPLDAVVAWLETPCDVLDSGGEAEVEEVRRMILEGQAGPHDLVEDGSGWKTMAESPHFDEQLAAVAERERSLRRKGLALAAVATAVAGLLAWGVLRLVQ